MPFTAPDLAQPLTTGQYMLMDLLMAVPVVNLVMLIVWGFSEASNINRKNWARSRLIWLGIGLGISILVMLIVLLGTT